MMSSDWSGNARTNRHMLSRDQLVRDPSEVRRIVVRMVPREQRRPRSDEVELWRRVERSMEDAGMIEKEVEGKAEIEAVQRDLKRLQRPTRCRRTWPERVRA